MEDELTSIRSTFPSLVDEITLLRSAFPTETTLTLCNDGLNLDIILTSGVCEAPVNVLLKLHLFFPEEYPTLSPVVKISDPVGLSDLTLHKLQSAINFLVDSYEEDQVIFPLIECCRDFISDNIPSVGCAICFDSFRTEKEVHRTNCNHFFHKECLTSYHNVLINTHTNEVVAIRIKSPYCPKEMLPELKFPCPICKTELPAIVDAAEN